jgi:DNA mismatch repair ATPase MutS
MNSIEGKGKKETVSFRLSSDLRERLSEIKSDFGTQEEMIEELMNCYCLPNSVNKENVSKIEELINLNNKLSEELDILRSKEQSSKEFLLSAENKIETLTKINKELTDELHKHINCICVPTNEYYDHIWDYLCKRDSKRYNLKLEPNMYIRFVVDKILIEGNKFAFDSVPNSVIKEAKKILKEYE